MNKERKTVIIGLGLMARRVYLPMLVSQAGVTITALVESNPDTLSHMGETVGVTALYPSTDHVPDAVSDDADMAIVLTPPQTHPDICIPLLDRGLDVFLEKPLALTLTEARRLVDASKTARGRLMVGLNRRFVPLYVEARNQFLHKSPQLIHASQVFEGSGWNEDARPWKHGARSLITDGIHMVDLVRWMAGGDVRTVQAAWGPASAGRGQEPTVDASTDTLTALLQFDNGVQGSVALTGGASRWIERVELHGHGHTVVATAPGTLMISNDESFHVSEMEGANFLRSFGYFGFQQEVDAFLAALDAAQPFPVDIEDAYRSHELVDEIYRAAGLPGIGRE